MHRFSPCLPNDNTAWGCRFPRNCPRRHPAMAIAAKGKKVAQKGECMVQGLAIGRWRFLDPYWTDLTPCSKKVCFFGVVVPSLLPGTKSESSKSNGPSLPRECSLLNLSSLSSLATPKRWDVVTSGFTGADYFKFKEKLLAWLHVLFLLWGFLGTTFPRTTLKNIRENREKSVVAT